MSHDPYGELARKDQAIKEAIDQSPAQQMATQLADEAERLLQKAGFLDHRVSVQLWVTTDSCGLTIVSPKLLRSERSS